MWLPVLIVSIVALLLFFGALWFVNHIVEPYEREKLSDFIPVGSRDRTLHGKARRLARRLL